MPLSFERREKVTRYLDPRADFAEVRIRCELRRDPLTGRSGRIAHVAGFQLQPPDLRPLVEASRPGCPFCPERVLEATPRFPPDLVPAPAPEADEGRIRVGGTVLFPNLAPYDEHSAVAALTREHYVPLGGFTPDVLRDGFEAGRAYFRALRRHPRTEYGLLFWNYLPPSGGTQIHPHFQLFATDAPGNALEEELAASRRYCEATGRPYWADLAAEEEARGERFVARGMHTVWLTDFVGQSVLADVLVLFPGRRTLLDLPAAALEEFCRGLAQALRRLETRGVYSVNLAWFPGPFPSSAAAGEDRNDERADFWLHARLSPRVFLTPRLWGPDASALQHLYREHFMVQTPEDAAAALRGALAL